MCIFLIMLAADEQSSMQMADDPTSCHDLSHCHDPGLQHQITVSQQSGLRTPRSCVVVSDPDTVEPSSAPPLIHPPGRVLPVAKTPSGANAELATVVCRLETKELWERFHQLGTEMIITKSGRLVPVPDRFLESSYCTVSVAIAIV